MPPGQARLRALVCDSDPRSVRALKVALRAASIDVHSTAAAEEALDHAAIWLPDTAIIALELPGTDGVEVCRQLRGWSAMPLLMLGATDDEDEKVRALQAGADHYITKPFGHRELVARLRATLRRPEPAYEEPSIRLEGLEIDMAARVLRHDDEEVRLTPIEFKLLRALLRQRGRPLAHESLRAQVWGAAYVDDTQTLRVHIANLRRKMGPFARYVRTDHGFGYRLLEPPTVRDASRPLRLVRTASAQAARLAA